MIAEVIPDGPIWKWMHHRDAAHYISLGAGVQSSTIALMAAKGLIKPMPKGAVFSDTKGEPASVYRWLDWLETQLPFPVYRVSAGDLEESLLTVKTSEEGKKYLKTSGPFYTLGTDGTKGVFQRQCTRDFKIHPVHRKIKQAEAVPRSDDGKVRAIQWIGFSADEFVRRAKESREWWSAHRWPLMEFGNGMTRQSCYRWMEENGYPKPPRSACVYCPAHDDAQWAQMKQEEPEAFAKAVEFEKKLQDAAKKVETITDTPYLHDSRQPLNQIKFDPTREPGLFGDCAEGMCGS